MKNKHKAITVIVLAIILAAGSIISIIAATPAKQRKIIIKTAHEMNFADTIHIKGRVEPVKKQVISLDQGQQIKEIYVTEGQTVKAGDAILELDDTELAYQLRIEEINRKLAEKELTGLLNNEDSDKKDLEYRVKKLETELQAEVSELEDLKRKQDRDKKMLESGIIAKESFEASASALKKQENTVSLMQLELERLKASFGSLDKDREDRLFKLNRELEKIGENIKNLKNKIGVDTKANIDGKLVKLDVAKGDYPNEENKEILIYDLSKYTININVKQQDAIYLKEGMKAEITLSGLEDKKYKGTVEDIEEIAEISQQDDTARVKVVVAIDNPDERIRIGYEAEVKLELKMKPGAVVVEYESILQDKDEKKYIYFVEDNFARKRPVRTGIDNGFYVEILEGIIAGDKYVVNPPEEMQEESSVRIWGWRYEFK